VPHVPCLPDPHAGLLRRAGAGRALAAMMLESFLKLFFTRHRLADACFGDANKVLISTARAVAMKSLNLLVK
jgi:hypothetical protein